MEGKPSSSTPIPSRLRRMTARFGRQGSVQERQVGFQLLATPIDRRHLPDGAWKFEDLDTRGAATRIVDGSATAARHRLLVQ